MHPRQDEHAGLGPVTTGRMAGDDFAYILKLLLAAHTLDAGFQAKAAKAFTAATGRAASKPPAVKGMMRMAAKLGTDYAEAAAPKSAENAYTNRQAWVL